VYASDLHLDLRIQVYLHSLTTGASQRVTNDCDFASHPSLSPEGDRIAYATHRYEDDPFCDDWETGLWTQSAEPFAPRTLLAQHGDGAFVRRTCWSPDGSRVAYSAYDTFFPNYQTINVVSASGGPYEVIVNDGSFNADPDWSPLDDELVFSSDRSGSYDIWLVGTDGSMPTQLTTDPALDEYPSWSPDGGRIAFVSDRSGNRDIWVMDADGGAQTQLTVDPATERSPTWSPDGSMIAFASDRADEGRYDLWLIAVE
jgi:Tol biopolymer transport system component